MQNDRVSYKPNKTQARQETKPKAIQIESNKDPTSFQRSKVVCRQNAEGDKKSSVKVKLQDAKKTENAVLVNNRFALLSISCNDVECDV